MARGRWDLLARSEHAHAPPERLLALGGGAGAARSLSQTEISLTASPCSERRRCKVGEHRLRAASSWEKYAGPVCVCVCVGGYSLPSVPTSFRLQIYLTLAASFCLLGVLKTRPLGCLPKLSRFGGRLGFTAPKGFRPCCVCILHCKSHGLKKKKSQLYPYFSEIKYDRQVPE